MVTHRRSDGSVNVIVEGSSRIDGGLMRIDGFSFLSKLSRSVSLSVSSSLRDWRPCLLIFNQEEVKKTIGSKRTVN